MPQYNAAPFNQYFSQMRIGVFDIETTGLSPSTSHLILSGFLIQEEADLSLHQFFAESLDDEETVLNATLELLDSLDVVITYNGRSFDIPFINARIRSMLSQSKGSRPFMPYNLDLYTIVRKFSSLRQHLPNLKQKTLENFLGLWESRMDEISGAESASMYMDYLVRQSAQLEEKILLHNRDDVIQLYRLLPVLGKADVHQAMFTFGFPVETRRHSFQIENIVFVGNRLTVFGQQRHGSISHTCFDSLMETCGPGGTCSWDFSSSTNSFQLELTPMMEQHLALMDLRALGISEEDFSFTPYCESGYLILRNQNQINYGEINLLIARLLERITEIWISQSLQDK